MIQQLMEQVEGAIQKIAGSSERGRVTKMDISRDVDRTIMLLATFENGEYHQMMEQETTGARFIDGEYYPGVLKKEPDEKRTRAFLDSFYKGLRCRP